jgi:hypothetical protein
MSGPWPPDWEDPDEVSPAEVFPDSERLSEVAACLASAPAPVMPAAVEARISAALAAEAAARAAGTPEAGDTAQAGNTVSRALRRRPGRARVRHRPVMSRALLVTAPLLVCLLFAGLGLALSRGSTAQSSSASAGSAGSAAIPDSGSSSAASGPAVTVPGPQRQTAASAAGQLAVTVIHSGTVYRRETLASQVASVSASVSGAGSPPSARLLGCVLHLTGGAAPELVDQASYQGTTAYVIASPSRVWVVGLGCSVAKPELIVSAPRAG